MKKTFTALFILSLLLSTASIAQTLMPMPAFNSLYTGSARGYWLIAPCNFKITGLRVPADAGTGAQYIHVMKCHAPFPIASGSASTNFTTLLYVNGATNNTIVPVNIQIYQGDTIGIMGTAGTGNSYTASAVHTSTINGLGVTLTRLGYQGDINTGPAPTYWGNAITASGSISRVEMYYTTATAPNNASISQFVAPSAFCAGTHDVKVKLKNTGSNVINSVTVQWKVDGVSQSSISWTSPLDTIGGTTYRNDTIITIGSVSFPSGVTKNIKVWTEYPNSAADTVNLDDTVSVNIKPALSGNFTVGGTSPDYVSLTAAAADLVANGVCGPVMFNIRTGTYAGQQMALGDIAGSSAINTIVFQSSAAHRDSVIVNFNTTNATDGYIVRLTNSKYITIKNMTLTALGASYGMAVNLVGSPSNNTIQNCKLSGIEGGIYADDVTGGKNVFRDNLLPLTTADYGIYYYGNTTTYPDSNCFENNTIVLDGTYPLYIYYSRNAKIRNNTITGTSSYGMRVYYGYDALEITGNKIHKTSGTYGIYLYYPTGTAANKGLVANNSVTGSTYGIRTYYNVYQRFYNNTFCGTSYGIYVNYGSGYDNNEWRNNVIVNNGTSYAALITNSGANNTWDYNLYYTPGTSLFSAYATFAAWRAASGQDKNSINYRPGFTSATNLQPNPSDTASWAVNGRGMHYSLVTTDVNGISRPVTLASGVPDLGAYEVVPTSVPPVASMVAGPPITGYISQVYTFGGDTVARLAFDNTNGAPSFVHIRRRTGTVPPLVGVTAANHMNFYDSIYAPAGTYSYNMEMYYKNPWLGTMTDEGNMTIIKNADPSSMAWTLTSTSATVDSLNNKISASSLSDFGVFTGTDVSTPLPVKLISLNGKAAGQNVILTWSTASEVNSAHFNVEASTDGRNFKTVGRVEASVNSRTVKHYTFTHVDAVRQMGQSGAIYYRLACVDKDGSSANSGVIRVNLDRLPGKTTVSPNPFTHEFTIDVEVAGDAQVNITLSDISGKMIFSETANVANGANKLYLHDLNNLVNGVYFVSIELDGVRTVHKIVKQ